MSTTGKQDCIKAVLVSNPFELVQFAGRSSKIGCNIILDPTTIIITAITTSTTTSTSHTTNSL
jgi:hypothetical protein